MINLGALSAGVDRPLGTPEESSRLYRLMMVVIEGATIAKYLGDKAELEARMRYALDEFDEFDRNFVQPSRTCREAMLAAVATVSCRSPNCPVMCSPCWDEPGLLLTVSGGAELTTG